MHLTAEATRHMVGSHGLFTNLIKALGLDIIGIFTLVVLKIAGPDPAPGIRSAPDKRRSQCPLGLTHLGAGDLVDEAFVVFQGFDRAGDLQVHGAASRHGLEILRSHDTSHPRPAGRIFDAGHNVGKPDQILSGRPDDATLDFLIPQLLPDGPLGVGRGLAPDVAGIPNFDLAIVDIDVRRIFGFTFDDKVVKTGPGQFRCEKTTHIRAAQHVGQGRFGHDVRSCGSRSTGGRQDTAADNKGIIGTQRITALLGMVVKQICVQTPATYKLLSDRKRDRFCLDITGGEIDICYLPV